MVASVVNLDEERDEDEEVLSSWGLDGFVEKDTDILDSAFVTLLRNARDPFVAKLMSGPSLAAERHSKDESIIVQTQVSSRPLRQPTPIPAIDGSLPAPGDEHPPLSIARKAPNAVAVPQLLPARDRPCPDAFPTTPRAATIARRLRAHACWLAWLTRGA